MSQKPKNELEDGLSSSSTVDPHRSAADEQVFEYDDSRKLGVTSAMFLIVNKMVGTGIFSTPSGVFAGTGSVGMSLLLWVFGTGGVIAFAGLSVYLEFGLQLPFNAGEKNYLERVYRKPKYLATVLFMSQMILLRSSATHALGFGRGIAVLCMTFVVLLYATFPKWGVRLLNVLGLTKVIVLLFIVCMGFAALAGYRKVPDPRNFQDAFRFQEVEGLYGGGGAYSYATAILKIIFTYEGWESANHVLGELRNPLRTLAVAAPFAVGGVTILNVLVNVAYFAAIPKSDFASSEVIIAGLFFRNVFGEGAATRVLSAFVSLSNLGTVCALSFAHSRVNAELAKEGLLPWSRFWASNKPFNSPAASLFLHWIVTVIVLLGVPAGQAYNLLVDVYTYPTAWINALVAAGLMYLHFAPKERWTSPWQTYLPIIGFYMSVNIFVAVIAFVPPDQPLGASRYPYYLYPVVGVGVLLLGGAYWLLWTKFLPYFGGYKVVTERRRLEGGAEVVRYTKVAVKKASPPEVTRQGLRRGQGHKNDEGSVPQKGVTEAIEALQAR